jgi:hypothetical protein
VFFSVVIVLAFNATEGNTTSDTTTQYSEKQQFIKSIPTFGGGHKHWVVAKMGRAADKIYTDRRPTGKEVWKYRDSCTGDYIIFYFDGNDMLIDYKIGSSY